MEETAAAVSPGGREGGMASGDGVVAEAGALRPETLPAPSYAETLYEYVVAGFNPLSE